MKKELEGEKKERMRMVIHPRPRPHPSCTVHRDYLPVSLLLPNTQLKKFERQLNLR